MATLRIRFVSGADYVSAAIRAAQLDFLYTHAEVELPGGEGYLGAHAEGGVQIRPVGYDAGPGTHEHFIALEVSDTQEAAFYAYLRDQLNKPYDFAAIEHFAAGLLIHPDELPAEGAWMEPSRWFCSELVMAAVIHAGILMSELICSARRITPQVAMCVCDTIAKLARPAQAANPGASP